MRTNTQKQYQNSVPGDIISNDMNEGLPIEILFYLLVGVLFLGFWVMSFVILYHLTRFGVGVQPKRVAVTFLLGAVTLFCLCVTLLIKLDVSTLLS